MSAPLQEPSREQLLAMAYVDGELDPKARAEFENEIGLREDVRREVVQLQRLGLLARSMAGPEPIDHEWRKLARDPLQKTSTVLAFAGMAVGATGLAALCAWQVWKSDMEALPKFLLAALCGGALLLFLVTLRGRLRTLPYDPYTEIER